MLTYTTRLNETINITNDDVSIASILHTSSNGVGIGTHVPQQKFHVEGLAYVQSNIIVGDRIVMKDRSLGLGIESIVVHSNENVVLNPNIPYTYLHITEPSNSSNFWDGFRMAPTIKLPRQYNSMFTKNIMITTSNTTPYYVYLGREDASGKYAYSTLVLDQTDATLQKSFTWSSGAWLATDQDIKQGLNHASFYFGDQDYTGAGSSNFIGSTISWVNLTYNNKLAFRITAKCSLASDSEIAYHQFESLVSPVDDFASQRPKGITSANMENHAATSFSNITHTITRHSGNSVDVKVIWDTSATSYVGNVELQVLASTRLGDIAFAPIRS